MAIAQPIKGQGWEDGAAVLMARVTDVNGDLVVQADISSISLIVEDKAIKGTAVGASPYTITVSDVIFDTIQTPTNKPIWTADSTGYNFRYDTLAAQMPDGNKTYVFEFWFTPADASTAFPVRYEVLANTTLLD